MAGSSVMLLLVVAVASLLMAVNGHCPNYCSGHGDCSFDRTMQCTCYSGWDGPDCSLRTCATGLAWTGVTLTTDGLHTQVVECSNMGKCNRQTGLCECESLFTGLACEKMKCPNDCSGHGRCMTMREAATTIDGRELTVDTTYTNWDADKMQGCVCDQFYHGHDCSLRSCPSGDDPETTGQVDEVQVINCLCDTCSGYFHIRFRGEVTGRIAHNAVATIALEDSDVLTTGIGAGESIQAKLQALSTLNDVTVSIVGTSGAVCDDDTPATTILFHQNGGDLPALEVESFLVAGAGAVTVTVDTDGTGTSVQGTTEDAECSNRGLCDTSRGVCNCFDGYGASNGDGAAGTLADCGARNLDGSVDYTGCPNDCQGVGDCDLVTLVCSCYAGYTGGDCSRRDCSYGAAWFDEAYSTDAAHQSALCSNMGKCNYASGECECQSGFTGGACQRLNCPGPESLRPCNQRGRCLSNKELARVGTLNGDFIGDKEVQQVTCLATSGTFTLTFRHSATNAIAFDATEATVVSELQALVTVGLVTVGFMSGATTPCSGVGAGNSMLVTFDYNFGDLPLMTASTSTGEDITVTQLTAGSRVTYGETDGVTSTWDADMLHGCLCDGHPSYNKSSPAGDVGYFVDHACTLRSCPYGHDVLALESTPIPTIQEFTCGLSAGTFQLEFRTQRTAAIAFDASEDDVKDAIESLDSVGLVNVTFIGSVTPCDAAGVSVYVLFTTELGELPLMRGFASTNEPTDLTVSEVQASNTTNIECADRGTCDRELGVCKCFNGYISGNGFGERGGRGDCGFGDPLAVNN